MKRQETSVELVSENQETSNDNTAPVDVRGTQRIRSGEGSAQRDNLNNNRLGEILQSTEPIDIKKRPSILSNCSFLFAVVDIVLASLCTW